MRSECLKFKEDNFKANRKILNENRIGEKKEKCSLMQFFCYAMNFRFHCEKKKSFSLSTQKLFFLPLVNSIFNKPLLISKD